MMKNSISRCIQLDDWLFEVKMVRALRVKDYGKPYSAIANLCLNGNQAYVDGIMNKNQHDLTEVDYQTLEKFCLQLGIEQVKFSATGSHSFPADISDERNINGITPPAVLKIA